MPTRDRSSKSSSLLKSLPVLIPVVAGLLLLLIAAVLVIVLVWQRVAPDEESAPGMPADVVKVTPTSFVSPVMPPSAECQIVVGSDDAQATVSLPSSLVVGEWSVAITPAVIQGSGQLYPSDYSDTAVWVCGTVVNYIVALEPSSESDRLVTGLRPGDEIRMRLSSGADLVFRFSELLEVSAGDPGVLAQSHPQLTMIVQADSRNWLVASADYVPEFETVSPPADTLTPLGQVALVGDARVMVEEGYAETEGAGLQAGTKYYLVEFSIENAGAEAINLSDFALQLQDAAGNWYSVSPEASALGKYGWLLTGIAPGSSARGTAGYVVPETMAGPYAIWSFADLDSEAQASFRIPSQASGMPPGLVRVSVAVTDVFLSRDGSVVVVEGALENVGDEPATVELGDISLTSSSGASELRLAAPPLPWAVQPGKTQVVELQFSKPDASAVLLSLLGYTFEIEGLK